MNIYVLDLNPIKCAEAHCDKHVISQCVEYTQILSSAHLFYNSKSKDFVCKQTEKNHINMLWVLESNRNYDWLYKVWDNLLKEYEFRFGVKHKYEDYKKYLIKNPVTRLRMQTSFKVIIPEKYQMQDAVQSYRKYYINEKDFHKFTKRTPPEWLGLKPREKTITIKPIVKKERKKRTTKKKTFVKKVMGLFG